MPGLSLEPIKRKATKANTDTVGVGRVWLLQLIEAHEGMYEALEEAYDWLRYNVRNVDEPIVAAVIDKIHLAMSEAEGKS